MKITEVQDQAIQARMALEVGAKAFDRFFAGIHFDEVDGYLLCAFAKDEERAAEIGDNYALHIWIILQRFWSERLRSFGSAKGASISCGEVWTIEEAYCGCVHCNEHLV